MKAYTLLLMILFVNTQSFGQKIPVLRWKIGSLVLAMVFSFPDYWIKYRERTPIKFKILEVYAGEKYSDTAIGEIKSDGKYRENM